MGTGLLTEPYRSLATMTAHFQGRPYRLERVKLDDLHDWCQHHGLRVAGTAQGLTNTWPVLICERSNDAEPAARRR